MRNDFFVNLLNLPNQEDSSPLVSFTANPVSYPIRDSTEARPMLKSALKQNAESWFLVYAKQWTRETAAHSSMTLRKRHPAYKEIVNLGWEAVPFLLKALKSMPDIWFQPLREITHEDPVEIQDRGDYDKMVDSWINWGRDKGISV